jgi:hypothetical protein
MPIVLPPFEDRLRKAVAHYWRTLAAQSSKQKAGMDHGRRSAVTGGKQMDGFCELVDWVLRENGLEEASIYVRSDRELPGFFRPTKEWDMLVVHEGRTVAALAFTSQQLPQGDDHGSARTEEVIGMANDMWTAFREEAIGRSRPRPWLGWVMLIEDETVVSRSPPKAQLCAEVLPEFLAGPHGRCRHHILQKFTQERLIDSAVLLASPCNGGGRGVFVEPAEDLSMKRLLSSLVGRLAGYLAEARLALSRNERDSTAASRRRWPPERGPRRALA